jgi:pyridoxal/pyridoxine/pyridoxamine kinase
MSRLLTLYMVPAGNGQRIVTDHGETVASIDSITPNLLEAHALVERQTGATVKLIAPIETVTRYTGVVMTRVTEDHDDPILTRLIRMIHG